MTALAVEAVLGVRKLQSLPNAACYDARLTASGVQNRTSNPEKSPPEFDQAASTLSTRAIRGPWCR